MSNLRLTTLSNQGGTASVPSDTVINGTAKAWVNFNGTGTVAIRASFNVSSITDDGTGVFRINMTTAMLDNNYCTVATIGGASSNFLVRDNSDAVSKTTTQFRINCATLSGPADVDPPQVNVTVFR